MFPRSFPAGWRVCAVYGLLLGLVCLMTSTSARAASTTLVQLSSDPYTNASSQHQTEVEPSSFAFGATIVTAFQVGRFTDHGSTNAGWATSTNGGASWTHGFLPGITVAAGGSFARVSNTSVAYDARHHTWLIASLAIGKNTLGAAIVVSRSSDGGLTWEKPVIVHAAAGSEDLDKGWSVCDNTARSPFYGHCYVEWDDNTTGLIQMSTSTNGGQQWDAPRATANHAIGIGGQPVVQPDGKVIVPIDNPETTNVLAFTSSNGGASWSRTTLVAGINNHVEIGLRSAPLPSAAIDRAGNVYVVWEDCNSESGCSANDFVLSTSTSGTTWSKPVRIGLSAIGKGIDHFLPALAVDPATSGGTAHLALVFNYYPESSCSSATCQLYVGYASSMNGGATWSAVKTLAGPMKLSWLANTILGRMIGDYISIVFSQGKALPFFPVATQPSGKASCETGVTCHEAIYTTAKG